MNKWKEAEKRLNKVLEGHSLEDQIYAYRSLHDEIYLRNTNSDVAFYEIEDELEKLNPLYFNLKDLRLKDVFFNGYNNLSKLQKLIKKNFSLEIYRTFADRPKHDFDYENRLFISFNSVLVNYLSFVYKNDIKIDSAAAKSIWQIDFARALWELYDQDGLAQNLIDQRPDSQKLYNIMFKIKKGNGKKNEFVYLLERPDLFKNYIIPFRESGSIYANGVEYSRSQIGEFKVTSTFLNETEIQYLREFDDSRNTEDFFFKFVDETNNLINHQTLYENQLHDGIWSMVHPKIYQLVIENIRIKKNFEAIRTAVIELNDIIKQRYKDIKGVELDGDALMRNAFNKNSPVFKIVSGNSENAKKMQQGYMELFAGTIQAIRNPLAHKNVQAETNETFEKLMLISHLLTVFENCQIQE